MACKHPSSTIIPTSIQAPIDESFFTPSSEWDALFRRAEQRKKKAVSKACLTLASLFFNRYGKRILGHITDRKDLLRIYCDTFAAWSNGHEKKGFGSVLYALANKLKVCRVQRGRTILWL